MRKQFMNDPEISAFFKELKAPQREIVESLHDIIISTIPRTEIQIKWGKPWYSKNEDICYLAAYSKHINFGFVKGAELDDPDSLLEGTGKGMRHIKIKSAADINKKELTQLLKAAAELDESKG